MVTMRERVQLHGQVRVLTAEGRFSAKVLVALPLLMAVYLLLFKKAYLRPLYTTGAGIVMLIGGVAVARRRNVLAQPTDEDRGVT